ncbi:hypothetical protein D3C78_1553200 [compost metagenome]
MVADPERRLLRQLAHHPHLERQGVAQFAHEQLRPALAALGRGRHAQAFIEGEQCGHGQAEQHHQQHPNHAPIDAQALHQTAALK